MRIPKLQGCHTTVLDLPTLAWLPLHPPLQTVVASVSCAQKICIYPSSIFPYRREATFGWVFLFAELWVGAARLNRKFCFHEIKGVGSMEIIPWGSMEELESVLELRGGQTPPPDIANKPSLPNPHN